MVEQRRTFHKQRKWRCPRCGRARMQATRFRERAHDRYVRS